MILDAIKVAAIADIPFLFQCLKELRGNLNYDESSFHRYMMDQEVLSMPSTSIVIGHSGGNRIGMLTCNRFAMPRFLGFGVEIEEVVVLPEFQGKGLGRQLIKTYLEEAKKDSQLRKVIIKTDDLKIAGRLYASLFSETEMVTFSKKINLI